MPGAVIQLFNMLSLFTQGLLQPQETAGNCYYTKGAGFPACCPTLPLVALAFTLNSYTW
jgi:hypothetical protein